jgi:hypothetical protein
MNLSMFFAQCRSGGAFPAETFQGFNRLRNVNDGVANPVMFKKPRKLVMNLRIQCRRSGFVTPTETFQVFMLVPKLRLGNPVNCSRHCSRSLFQTRFYLPHPWSRTTCIHAVAASRVGKLELPKSQASAWERAIANPVTPMDGKPVRLR